MLNNSDLLQNTNDLYFSQKNWCLKSSQFAHKITLLYTYFGTICAASEEQMRLSQKLDITAV